MPTLTRRNFLSIPLPGSVRLHEAVPRAVDKTVAGFPAGERTLTGGLTPYAGPWGPEQAAHLLRRTTFGVTKPQLDAIVAKGSVAAAVNSILTLPPAQPDPPVNLYNHTDPVNPQNSFTDPTVPAGQTWINAPLDYTNPAVEIYRTESWRGWWMDLMLTSGPNIREKMTLFWHNHFATRTETVFFARASYLTNILFRKSALGNFKTLVKAVTLDPGMLIFLNGYLNGKDAPDENYARELQELFTIGKDSANQYTEDDVVQAARVLTGWRLNPTAAPGNEVYFNPFEHDTGAKQFSAFYNNTVIQGNFNGDTELNHLLNMIFAKQEVAAFLCRKLYRFFVYYKIDQTVENDIIQPLAEIFRNNNYEIRPVLEALFTSEHFYSQAALGCMIKSPLDHVIGVMRNFNLGINAPTPYETFETQYIFNYFSGSLLMLPGDPPNVAGWQAYRQSPQYYRIWINSDTMRNRNIYTDALSFYFVQPPSSQDYKIKIDHIAFASQFAHPEDPNKLIADALRMLVPVDLTAEQKAYLKGILLYGQANDYYWTNAWNAYKADPTNQMNFETVWFRLALLHKYIMNLPEFQLG